MKLVSMTFAPTRSLMLGLATLFILMAVQLDRSDEGKASIHLAVEDSTLVVQGLYTHHGEREATRVYTLNVLRDGAAGSSASAQSGRFTTVAGQVDTLATSRVSVSEGDRLVGQLTIRAEGTPVATASVDCVYPGCRTAERDEQGKSNRG